MLGRTFLAMVLLANGGCASRGATTVAAHKPMLETVTLQVDAHPSIANLHRVGVNLGSWTSWGAEQLSANVIKNPGFEGVIDRALAVVRTTTPNAVVVDGDQGRPDGFWQGATIDVRSGLAAGQIARVITFHRDASKHEATLTTTPRLALVSGDLVALTKVDDSSPPTQWWIPQAQSFCGDGPPRPNSPGKRSFLLCPSGGHTAEVNSYLDGIGDRAGKLLPVSGKWRLSFWYRTAKGSVILRASLRRQPSTVLLDSQISPSRTWQQSVIDFDALDAGPAGALQLQFLATGDGEVNLDDVSLHRSGDGAFPFRAEVVAVLQQLHPAYLRDWEGQLGDTVANRLMPPFGRRASRYRSGKRDDAQYGYSIPEFLELCDRVSASPWIVLPTTASDEEFRQLGTYLQGAQKRFHFDEVLVEFGNENWNPLFGTAGIADAALHGKVSSRAFALLRSTAGESVPLRTVVNAQFANPRAVEELARLASADVVAVAPYFAFNLPANANTGQTTKLLFTSAKNNWASMSGQLPWHRELAVYEVNLHTVGGDATPAERDSFVLTAASGTALAQRLIEAMQAGVTRQCVYALSGYDAFTQHGRDLVQLFGIVRDLGAEPKLRGTGLAMMMLNQVVQAEGYEVHTKDQSHGDGITAIAFHGDAGWSAAVTSSREEDTDVCLQFPAQPAGAIPRTVMTLLEKQVSLPERRVTDATGTAPYVAYAEVNPRGNCIRIRVPARGLVTLATSPRAEMLVGRARP